jgi:hypothetical protein
MSAMLSRCRLIIADHADSLINQIDLHVELTLATNKNLDELQRERLDLKRNELIHRIRSAETFNLNSLNSVDSNELENLDPESLNKKVFKKFCFFLGKNDFEKEYPTLVDSVFGYLIIVDAFLSSNLLSLFKELLKFHNKTSPIGLQNKFFKLKYDEVYLIVTN